MHSDAEMQTYSAFARSLEQTMQQWLGSTPDDVAIAQLKSLLQLYFEDLRHHPSLATAFIIQLHSETISVQRHAFISALAGFAASAELRASRWRNASPWTFALQAVWDAGRTKPAKLLRTRIAEATKR
jgi:hypothetical protein